MNRIAIVVAAFLIALTPAAFGQTPNVTAEVSNLTKAVDQAATAQAQKQKEGERTEDIEILRRILNKTLGAPDGTAVIYWPIQNSLLNEAYDRAPGNRPPGDANAKGTTALLRPETGAYNPLFPNSNTIATFTYNNASTPARAGGDPIDGIYLAGHGVVFTLRIPASAGVTLHEPVKVVGLSEVCAKCHGEKSQADIEKTMAPPPPPTEWEQTRGQLRAPTSTPPSTPPAAKPVLICKPGELAYAVIEKLTANARHIRHLPVGENITFVVTYEGHSAAVRDSAAKGPMIWDANTGRPLQAAGGPQTAGGFGASNGDWYGVPVLPSGTWLNGNPPASGGRPGFSPEEVNLLTLGDLHLKQNKPKEAAEAYERALSRYKAPVFRMSAPPRMTPAQVSELIGEHQQNVRGIYRQLALAWLTVGDLDRSQAALDQSRKFRIELADKADPAAAAAVLVPAKLIISVAKADLDKAGGDPSAFRKAVKIETIGFPPPDVKKAAPGP
ncbi:tetratricopeptide repeat protein [Fimbriiglobus ruber]|uniref:Tetratricopeptide repeat protein n=1 Tax=Fimbriiglobus ruber TaxID=1908690 RepID=A0A225E701_9BACT|nr:tetratricopeptide repeat protein [Fimbriiglobus ruber]OWK44445.1 hypothetical protein FRUB_02377 [Fimbriiglobus ruber]